MFTDFLDRRRDLARKAVCVPLKESPYFHRSLVNGPGYAKQLSENMKFIKICLLISCLLLTSVSAQKKAQTPTFKVDYTKFTLPNGLEVVFHIDRSDPVVAVA